MREFVKPHVVVSRCIEFEPVRYDGRMISSDLVKSLRGFADFIPVCPEVEIGLSVPRETLRIVKVEGNLRLVQPATGLDFTEKINEFSDRFLGSLPDVDGFILKGGSPSSALKDAKVYLTVGKAAPVGRGAGFFGGAVVARFGHLAVEDERRLLNSRIREHFLTKLYTLADFRSVKNSGFVNALISFQARNKLLFTAYSQVELHAMGNVVAHQKDRPWAETIREYEACLWRALRRPPRRGANENVLTKAVGYFTSRLSKGEKAFFLDTVSKYKAGKFPLSTPLNVLKAWIIRFDEPYLLSQTFFEPYPAALVEQEIPVVGGDEKDYWK
jgi:uncharacterized protein YbgA (DUF1722 family)/uncharacterized protein YbbK (DUF523 family)